jgi:acyl-homoserine lactone acylase PvdQ|eukprot:COSAG06_NODE_289_length_18231_cov_20.202515_20_plen_49_part_00
MLPLIGWTGENDWQGDTPWERMPHSLNPPEGKIVSVRNRCVTRHVEST